MIKAVHSTTFHQGRKKSFQITDKHDRRRILIQEPDKPDISLPDWSAGWACSPGLTGRKGYNAMPKGVMGDELSGWWIDFRPPPGRLPSDQDRFFVLSVSGKLADYVARGARHGASPLLWLQAPAVFGDRVRAIDNQLAGLSTCKACEGTGNEFAGASAFRACAECSGTGGVGGTGIGQTGETH